MPPTARRQTLMFSATFAKPIQRVAASYLRAPFAHVAVGRVGSAIGSVSQHLVHAGPGDKRTKLQLLRPLLAPDERTIVFVQKKHVAKWVRDQLDKEGVACADIHGDRSQGQREAALAAFADGSIDVLVATDVASRGIDVPEVTLRPSQSSASSSAVPPIATERHSAAPAIDDYAFSECQRLPASDDYARVTLRAPPCVRPAQVAHVVQFDLPITREDMDTYVHRIGRTGRAGRSGKATALFVPGDEPKVGNGMLWADLAALFEENQQPMPAWFDECRPRGVAPRASPRGLPAVHAAVPAVSTRRKGASNNRRARRAAAAAAAGRPPNAGPPLHAAPAAAQVVAGNGSGGRASPPRMTLDDGRGDSVGAACGGGGDSTTIGSVEAQILAWMSSEEGLTALAEAEEEEEDVEGYDDEEAEEEEEDVQGYDDEEACQEASSSREAISGVAPTPAMAPTMPSVTCSTPADPFAGQVFNEAAPEHARPLPALDEAAFIERALREDAYLGAGAPLRTCEPERAASVVRRHGVARLDGVLSESTARELHAYVLGELDQLVNATAPSPAAARAKGKAGAESGEDAQDGEDAEGAFRLVAVGSGTQRLSRFAAAGEGGSANEGPSMDVEETRWDLRLSRDLPIVRRALKELLLGIATPAGHEKARGSATSQGEARGGGSDCRVDRGEAGGALGNAIEHLGGAHAELWEVSAIVSVPGAPPQVVHADAMWTPEPLLLTAFVGLQPVARTMGPTRFLPRTHTSAEPAEAVAMGDATSLGASAPPSWVGLLGAGDAALYDGRLLHCGGANRADRPRALFYVTFRAEAEPAEQPSMEAMRASPSTDEAEEVCTLASLREELRSA